MSRTAMVGVLAATAGLWVTFAAWLIWQWGGPDVTGPVADFGSVVIGAAGTLCNLIARRALRTSDARRTAALLAVALACWTAGDLAWAFSAQVFGRAPFPSVADIGYLLFYVALCAALLTLPAAASVHLQARLILDGVIVAGSLFVILWAAGLADLAHRADGRGWAFAISLAYPLADLVLLTIALLIVSAAPVRRRAVPAGITMAVVMYTVADGAFVYLDVHGGYLSGVWVDIVWAAGLSALGVITVIALRHEHESSPATTEPSRWTLWMPYVPLTFATICVAISPASMAMLVAALAVVAAIAGRQFLVADENRRLMKTLAEQARRDPLTGLVNRFMFRGLLASALLVARRSGRPVAVLSIDLDDFKSINDSLGHAAGDTVLMAVARRLGQSVDPEVVVARLGGDEFAVLVVDPDRMLDGVISRIVDSFNDPFPADGHDVLVRASIGVTTADHVEAADADDVLKHADIAMYSAKRNGGGVRRYAADMQRAEHERIDGDRFIQRRRRTGNRHLAAQLRHAIGHGELGVLYQPQVRVATGQVSAVEVLVRWNHPERGILRPDEFLPLARHNDLMGALTDEVLRMAVADVADWQGHGLHMPFAVNLFPPSLGDHRLPEHVAAILAAGELDGSRLTIEITEDVLLANEPAAREVLGMLRDKGTRVAIDDFGSGYAGLQYLRTLPVDEVKLDRHLIAPMTTDQRADAIVAAMIGLSHSLGLNCVAEGVEDAAVVERLEALGCDVMQGYICGPPVTAQHFLHAHRPHLAARENTPAEADLSPHYVPPPARQAT
ncbi:putative bifunctional diguanylate cyclase/phosphodiesterase [Mycolicibacterium bacteremicum]|nr:bifunctional diguanylate cyclase/phosphodiesterase [Mycolicibacterium bacteremicum]MCV7435075.1 bifunctional diguanylate cyclase/phosphodiesterase [Mycolicibacterium bacteremicum]